MGGERQSRITELYHAALARAPKERVAFLKEACADDDSLRDEIESLLGYESVPGFLGAPAAALAGPVGLPRDLGSYRLIAPLGSGGMGDVYRARDTKLGRDVAVKVLPPHLMADPERRARFVREARLLATLNHPHIGIIHGFEEADGIAALVLELVEGQTLADRLERGPLPIADALMVARQIAEALEAAHDKGIIHRDLKPSNIVLQGGAAAMSSDLCAKVLDFGLAKPATDALAGARPDNPTMSAAATVEGRILGTPAYMSPEQARGLTVDKRTDIWSFGCVLYEMLTGHRPFRGDTTTDVMAAVVGRNPDWKALPSETPHRVRLLLARCLQKDPKLRLHDIGDARIELGPVDDVELGPSDASLAGSREPAKSRLPIITAVVAGLIAGIIAAAWWYRHTTSSPQTSGSSSTAAVHRPFRGLTFEPGLQTDPTFSPDGRLIAYASDQSGNFDIWVQPVDGSSPPRQLTNSPAAETQPSWSPNGTYLVFRSEGEKTGLFRIPFQGGPARQLTSFGIDPTWSTDSSQVLFRTSLGNGHTALFTVPADGGTKPSELCRSFLKDGIWDWIGPHPDGRISAIGFKSAPERRFAFFTMSRDGTNVVESTIPKDLSLPLSDVSGRTRFQWNDKGNTLYVEAVVQEVRNIWRVRVDPTTLAWTSAERLTTGAGADVRAAISHDGRMVYAIEEESTRLWAYPLDANAGRIKTDAGLAITPEEGRITGGVLSPGGDWFVYEMTRPGSDRTDALMTNIATGKTDMIAPEIQGAAWSPDGRLLVYATPKPPPKPRPWALASRGMDGNEQILRPWNWETILAPTSWTPDGKFIVGTLFSPIKSLTPKIVSWPADATTAGSETVLLEHPERGLWEVQVSPNAKWLAFVCGVRADTNTIELYIARERAPYSDWIRVARDHRWTDKPRWSPDGKLLYFISNAGSSFFNLWAIHFDPERGAVIDAPFPLTHFDTPALSLSTNMQTSGIGISATRAILPMVSARGHIWMLENVDR